MTTMRAKDDILSRKMRTDAGRDGLFTDVGVARAVDQAALMGPGQLFLAAANEQHLAKEIEKLFRARR